jgi:hypothetical protein
MENLPSDPAELRKELCQSFLEFSIELSEIEKRIFERLMLNDQPVLLSEFVRWDSRSMLPAFESAIESLNAKLSAQANNKSSYLAIVKNTAFYNHTIHLCVVHRQKSDDSELFRQLSNRQYTISSTSPISYLIQDAFVISHPITDMSENTNHMVFLCHSSGDKEKVRRLHSQLKESGFRPWLDEEDLIPGARWESEIRKAVKQSDIVLVCLSKSSITKEGFVQKEIKIALDIADEKPEETIYIIPARLEECAVPARLSGWQFVDLFRENGFDRLVKAIRSKSLKA